jgi:ribosomal protein S6
MEEDMKRHVIQPEDVGRISEWLSTRGGIAVWESQNLSDPGRTVTTPVLNADGTPVSPPGWQFSGAHVTIIRDPEEVWVSVDEEVKRFRVGVRQGSQGLMLKVTDGGTRRIRNAVIKAGEGSYHVFDYDTQEAVIMRPISQKRLDEYKEAK